MNNVDDKKFIYVFSKEDSQKMMAQGYIVIQEDAKKNIYVFLADSVNRKIFALDKDMTYCFSNTLMF